MTNAGVVLVAAAALRDPDGRVLVQRRPPGAPLAGLWEFPGGKLEPGETPEAALARELAEELGIAVAPAGCVPLSFASVARADGPPLVLLLFECRRWTGEPRLLHADALRWVTPDELAGLPMPAPDVPLVAALRLGQAR